MAISLGDGRGPFSEINVTPMVDVVLVLLIIFMVAAPMIQQGLPVQLPQARGQALEAGEQQMVITLTRDKTVHVGETEVALGELAERLHGNLRLQSGAPVALHADRELDYGFVVDVMGVLQAAGVSNVGLVTDPHGPARAPARR